MMHQLLGLFSNPPKKIEVQAPKSLFWCAYWQGTGIGEDLFIPLQHSTTSKKDLQDFLEEEPEELYAVHSKAFKEVEGPLPEPVIEVALVLDQAHIDFRKAIVAYRESLGENRHKAYELACEKSTNCQQNRKLWKKVLFEHQDEIMALFRLECPGVEWDMTNGLVWNKPTPR